MNDIVDIRDKIAPLTIRVRGGTTRIFVSMADYHTFWNDDSTEAIMVTEHETGTKYAIVKRMCSDINCHPDTCVAGLYLVEKKDFYDE